jgi:C_GCAxxG_C_C family probable redox protein
MTSYEKLKEKVKELSARSWDTDLITARYLKLLQEGIPKKQLDPATLQVEKRDILDRVQRRAEEYNFLAKNCPQGTALALMEEFGMGNMEVVKALCPFPGIAGTGRMCGGVTGSLIALGLCFGKDDMRDFEATGTVIQMGQKFMAAFEDELGYLLCADIHEHVVFGRNMDPGAGPENMAAFAEARGFEKCGVVTGTAARIAARVMIDNLSDG